MSIATQLCDVVLPGYTIVDRIGSGGYAEVWRAEAPGGIQKAVKVVHGYCDDEFASQELKALERVKGVRHPFLLSLERFEVVNGRLAIITELADMSLDQRRQECCAEGMPGIPRDELLRYLADAAEAIDYLLHRHGLLHLDIKPENLLILGDHIKVADFGLVKEFATRTQNSLVSGLTPTYASPEMFDDEPSAQSDQYSLAIVYQQMLVGALPFPGRTAAQLAKQHTQAEPQLATLLPEDRPIIARALAKTPADRFPTCSAFVDALTQRASRLPAAPPVELPLTRPQPALPIQPVPADTKPPSFCTTLRREEVSRPAAPAPEPEAMVTRPVQRLRKSDDEARAEVDMAPDVGEEITDAPAPNVNQELSRQQPTLYVAVGGVGIQVLCRLRAHTENRWQDENSAAEMIALDINRDELRDACSKRWKLPFCPEDTLHIPLRLPKDYDDTRDILGWVSRRWLYNIPRSLETRGYRPLGRVALVDHVNRVMALIDQKLERLAKKAGKTDANGTMRDPKVRIVILAGTAGGTGAGTVIDLANAARAMAAERECPVEVHGFFVCPNFAGSNTSPLAVANTYALLSELNHTTAFGNECVEASRTPNYFESQRAPFDCAYLMPTRHREGCAEPIDSLEVVAQYLAMDNEPDAVGLIRSCRLARTNREELFGKRLTIRTLGVASLADRKRQFISLLADDLAAAVKRYWLSEDTSEHWDQLIVQAQQSCCVSDNSPQAGDSDNAALVVADTGVAPLALRARFKEYSNLQFTSEVLQQIDRQLKQRDERGRPLIIPREAKLLADAAASAVDAMKMRHQADEPAGSQFTDSAELRSIIVAASYRVLEVAIERMGFERTEQFLPADALGQLLKDECRKLLEECCAQPELKSSLAALVDTDQLLLQTIEDAKQNLLQCGADRRTLVFVPKDEDQELCNRAVRTSCPHAAVQQADVEDIVVVTESAGISPRSFASNLMRIFPGVADAAHRLHTRVDIEWQPIV